VTGRFPLYSNADVKGAVIGALRQGGMGVVTWPQEHYKKMTVGHIVSEFERLAEEGEPFRYPIRHIYPPM